MLGQALLSDSLPELYDMRCDYLEPVPCFTASEEDLKGLHSPRSGMGRREAGAAVIRESLSDIKIFFLYPVSLIFKVITLDVFSCVFNLFKESLSLCNDY